MDALVASEKEKALSTLQNLEDKFKSSDSFKALKNDQQEELLQSFASIKQKVESQKIVAVFREILRSFEDNELLQLFSKRDRFIKENNPQDFGGDDPGKEQTDEDTPEYISKTTINLNLTNNILETETDVDDYLETVKKAYLEIIKKGNRIRV